MSSLQLTTATIPDMVAHLPLSVWPVAAGSDALLGNSKVGSRCLVIESLEDGPLGVCRVWYHTALPLSP